ncbi:hypothetical protein RhiirA4_467692 [Rhizophagus irregularis]|uniref:Uncharacterized protein n=1 Tax=Rhizophagus irregularis TaxID=588596 RepID=A0A2I1GWD6_9GLOM|nr:hypothetical protein RhiirA4_467692 [Rhizophagus irregularis]
MSNSVSNISIDIEDTRYIKEGRIVVKIDLTHNHNLVPLQLRKFMPDNRNIKDKILGLHMAGTTI